MHIRSFTAPNMSQALQEVRKALGRDAVILGSRDVPEGIEVTAAIEDRAEETPPPSLGPVVRHYQEEPDEPELPAEAERLLRAVAFHGAPVEVNELICRGAASSEAPSLLLSLAAGLDATFRFRPVSSSQPDCLILVGPPGAGKTVVAAKFAVEAALRGRALKLATTDIERPGGEMRLMELAELVDNRPIRLAPGRRMEWSGPRLIDTEGVNPFDRADMRRLRDTTIINAAEPVLVLPAGGDPYEYEDIAHAFAEIGVRRLIATRLDTARRVGGLLSAAATGLSFAEAGASPVIADGLYPMTPTALARVVLQDPDGAIDLEEHRMRA
ncbi:MAG: hypothetical protein VYB54_08665 [Pseudomonadota bacterium]|nr:hypothetical protein [Pseudomonadota bacterium]